MARLFQDTHDIGADVLAAVGASLYFLAFFAAIHAALDKLAY
ncbi:MAG TPA: hypothetical protein VEY31_09695 [Roseococcus sp.]|nr:hypothetical protein [Roseococcus sp.]